MDNKMSRLTPQRIIPVIRETKGLITVAAQRLRCSRQALYNAMARYPSVKAAVDDEKEKLGDLAEAQLYRAINEGQSWAVCFYLKCIHKQRGFVERPEPQRSPALPFDPIEAIIQARANAIAKRQQQALVDGQVIDITPTTPAAASHSPADASQG